MHKLHSYLYGQTDSFSEINSIGVFQLYMLCPVVFLEQLDTERPQERYLLCMGLLG